MHHATVHPRNEPPEYTMRWEFKSWQLFSLSHFFKRHNKLQPGEEREGEREREREREREEKKKTPVRTNPAPAG